MKQLNADLHFRISGDTSFIHKLFNMDDTISELLNKSFEDVNKRKKGLENYLIWLLNRVNTSVMAEVTRL